MVVRNDPKKGTDKLKLLFDDFDNIGVTYNRFDTWHLVNFSLDDLVRDLKTQIWG